MKLKKKKVNENNEESIEVNAEQANKENNVDTAFDFEEEKSFKFNSLSFRQWYEIVQYIVNYDIILSNLERLDNLLEKKRQLKVFLDSKGIIPQEYLPIIAELNKKYLELTNIQSEISIGYLELSDRIKNEKLANVLQEELKNQMINKDNLKAAKEHVLYFRNPYFIDGDNQYFDQRRKALKIEYKNLNYSIRKIKPHVKKYKKKLDLYESQVKKILFTPNFDFDKLFKFVRPFINDIISSNDLYYIELVNISILD